MAVSSSCPTMDATHVGGENATENAAQTRPILATLIIIKTPHTRHTTQGGPIGYRAKGPRPASWERTPKGGFSSFYWDIFKKKKDLHFILEKEPYNTTGPLSTDRPKGRGQPRVSCLWSGTMAEPHRRDPGTQSTNKGYLATWARSSFGYARDSRAAYTVDADCVGPAEQRLCASLQPPCIGYPGSYLYVRCALRRLAVRPHRSAPLSLKTIATSVPLV